jgi:uncharacterized protein (DUF1800 family)
VNRDAVIAVNRFGLGAAPGELATATRDPRSWLLAQVRGPAPDYPQLASLAGSDELLKEFPRWLMKVRAERRGEMTPPMRGEVTPPMRGEAQAPMQERPQQGVEHSFGKHFFPIAAKEIGARFGVAATTPAPFHERLTWFWSNHFAVSADKPTVFAVAGAFEREAIRPNVNGRFVDLLLAATKHPAMILYLDNNLSVRPGFQPPQAAERANLPRATGLNENLAREILELHTLGVNGGYTQADVTTFARALTGWTVGGMSDTGFRFAPRRHEAGPKTILGRTYAQEGMAQGELILRDLAAHPATARHVATKLVRHFIADDPPPAAVERVARAFTDSGGELQVVYAALVGSPEAWAQPLPKLKQPIEFIASALRAVPPAREAKPEALFLALREMGQRPFFPPSPQGWPDTAAAWANADGLWKRIEWSTALAERVGTRVDPLAIAESTYGPALSEATRLAIMRAESKQQGLALALASPEFQRR